jgi:hypothetical protein
MFDLSSGEYCELSPATEPSGKMENFVDFLFAYGVTLGVDGSSKLLSVNFEQAESYAK